MWRSVFRDNLMDGKVALVTGGGTGIGKSIAKELSLLGCKVLIASRKEEQLAKTASELSQNGRVVDYVTCDIRQEGQVERMIDTVLERFGRLDFVVNNAGGQFPSLASSISAKGWRTVIDLNLTGTFLVCKAAYDKWFFDNGGTIVNIVATFHNGFPYMSHTSAARAGVANLTETLALEWAGSGVRINSVAPGIVFSKTAEAHYAKDTSEVFQGNDLLTRQAAFIPAKRLASTEEVSSCVVFLLSPGASYITGCTLKVDGGYTLFGQGDFVLSETAENYPQYGTLFQEKSKSKL